MTDLYARLDQVGFSRAYVRDRILPDWWEDDLANDPGNRRLAEMAISRTLKIPLQDLASKVTPLSLGTGEVRFKRWQATEESRLVPAVAIARRACELVLASARNLPAFRLEGYQAALLRESILEQSQYVSLVNLLQYAWDFGVPVVHLESLPDGAKRVDGMALLVEDRPCIALASSRRSPAWIIWHLAHELGHVASGHLRHGETVDIAIDFASENHDEQQANLYAKDVVYGAKNRGGFSAPRHVTGEKLAAEARNLGPMHRIAPACIVTSYGFNMNAWGTANKALNILGISDGGPEAIRKTLLERIDLDALPETDRHFLVKVTGIPE